MPPLTEANFDDPVTRHMQTEFARLEPHWTIGEALWRLRQAPPKNRILYLYVLDAENRLQGVVPTRRLLVGDPESGVADAMIRDVVTIPPVATVLDACEFFTQHRLLAFPVVGSDGKMIGVIDVEIYTDELRDVGIGRGDDLFQMVGVTLGNARPKSPVKAFLGRFPWLLANIAGGLVAAWISHLYEATLRETVALAMFVPVVLALSESVGMQSVSLALQWLHGPAPKWSSLAMRVWLEARAGLLLGAACGFVVATTAWLWLRESAVAACLLVAIASGVCVSAIVGLTIPVTLRLAKFDPGVAAGPVALALADMATLTIYFALASAWIG